MKLNTKTKYGFVGFASSAAVLGLVAAAVICPEVDGAFAADSTTTQNLTVGFTVNAVGSASNPMSKEGNLTVSFTVDPYIEISTAPGNVTLAADTPTDAGVTKSGSTPFSVKTNSANGFDVYVKATSPDLSGSAGNNSKITPIASNGIALGSFGANTWGYSITNSGTAASTYDKMTNGNVKAKSVSGFSSSATNLQLNFGTKVTNTIPSDTYSTTVTLSAVLSGASVASLGSDTDVQSTDTPIVYSEEQEVSDSADISGEVDDYGFVEE